ncbi:9f4bbf39-9ffe-4e22-9bd9-f6859a94c9a2 [Thermothielavioides terrestris]|uniref:9f4bbf39-9ffe-4e22-9bd9-f6859a94c9a2 n=1 Tax=Thermothielavioides terrestris TaxID=2587410 RepID=A0A446BT77_9PEZI|nr:9f4bbf39-9ffe-4e22-9bd9-f6859a94c9a2 [Thermothielavioides terrestris]
MAQSLPARLIAAVAGGFGTDFKYQYDEPDNSYHEIMMLLPVVHGAGAVSKATTQAALRRVVLHDHGSVVRFFMTSVRYPACVSSVEELHCHVNLGCHSSKERLDYDVECVESLSTHLDYCRVSLGILKSIHQLMASELADESYRAALDLRFRQSVFFSLLGHLRSIHTLRMTVYPGASQGLRWLSSELQHRYPEYIASVAPCLSPCPSLRKVALCATAAYPATDPWPPLSLWPLINLPTVEELELETCPGSQIAVDTLPCAPSNATNNAAANENISPPILAHLQVVRIKGTLATVLPTLRRLLPSTPNIHTLEIYLTTPVPFNPPSTATTPNQPTTFNLNTLLQPAMLLPRSLRYLSLTTTTTTSATPSNQPNQPTPPAHSQPAKAISGPAPDTLARLASLRALHIPIWALFDASPLSHGGSGGSGASDGV